MSLPGKLEQLLQSADSEELSHSERLWSYPFDAFDVPDFGVLTSYLEDSDSIEDKDLVFQIENSVNCLRALKHLAEEPKFEDQEPSEDSKASFERVLELMKSIPKSENESSAEETPSFSYHDAPRKFLLCKTKGKTPVLVDGQHRYSYTFDPPVVLLVNDGKESEAKEEETLFRAVPASFADEYPVNQMDVDQIKVSLNDGRVIVLHLNLNFPVSNEQLDQNIGFVDEADQEKVRVGVSAALQGIPLMPADGAGIGPSGDMIEVMALERERMFERSQSLADFADFNLGEYLEPRTGEIIEVDFTSFIEDKIAAKNGKAIEPLEAYLDELEVKVYFSFSTGELRISILTENSLTSNLDDFKVFLDGKEVGIIEKGMVSIQNPDFEKDFEISLESSEGVKLTFRNSV